jgi:transcriptional regulator with XRE-family HTH domain
MKKLDIKRALREHNMTQVELCKRTGLLTQNMSPIINGNPTISKLFQVAEGIGCDITDLFYPDPSEEETEKESAHLSISELKEIMKRAYPSIPKEGVEEIVKMIEEKGLVNKTPKELDEARRKHEGETLNATLRGDLPEGVINRDVKFVQEAAESEPAYPVHENGLVSDNQQQMLKTETFCPHCGQKVRVGVVLLSEQC